MDEQMEIKKAVGSTLASSQNKTKNKKRSKLKDAHNKKRNGEEKFYLFFFFSDEKFKD